MTTSPQYAVQPKSPTVSLVASLFIPGLGSIINGDTRKGVGILVGYLVSLLLVIVLIGIVGVVGFWIWGMIDGYQGAKSWNERHGAVVGARREPSRSTDDRAAGWAERPAASPGWYPSRTEGSHQERYWDGASWTGRTRLAGFTGERSPAGPPPPAPPRSSELAAPLHDPAQVQQVPPPTAFAQGAPPAPPSAPAPPGGAHLPSPASGTAVAAKGWGVLSLVFGALVLVGSVIPWHAGSNFSITDDLSSAWPILVTGVVALLGGVDGLRGSLFGPALAAGIGSVFVLHQADMLRLSGDGSAIGAGGVVWTVAAVAAVALLIGVMGSLPRDSAGGSASGWFSAVVVAGSGVWLVGMILPAVPGESLGDHVKFGLFGGGTFSDALTIAYIGVPAVLAVVAASTRSRAAYGLAAGSAVFWAAGAVTSAADEGWLRYGYGRLTPVLIGAVVVAVTGCLAGLIPPRRPARGPSVRPTASAIPVTAAACVILLPMAGIAGLVLDAGEPTFQTPSLAQADGYGGTGAYSDDTEGSTDSGVGNDPGTGGSVDVVCTDLVDSTIDSAWQDVTGAIHVTILVNNGCEAAQQLDDPSASFTLTGSGATVADATFDFSRQPIVVPALGTSGGELVFGPETFIDLEAIELLGLGDGGTASNGSLGITYSYVCTDASGGSSPQVVVEVAGVATGTPTPPSPTDEDGALARLEEISDADRPFVEAGMIDGWVPQISSKKPAVVLPNGTTWDAMSILEDHRAWRELFPRVRLLWSGDYSTFEATDYWVTVVAIPFATAGEANSWCDAQGLPAEDCYAKLVSHTHGLEDSTELR